MNEPAAALDPDCRPRLPRGVRLVHSEAQGGWVLLAPAKHAKSIRNKECKECHDYTHRRHGHGKVSASRY